MATTAAEQFEEDRDNALLGEYQPMRVAITYRSTSKTGDPSETETYALTKHLPDLSPITQKPLLRRAWLVSTGAVTPKRGDEIEDPDGRIWKVFDTQRQTPFGVIRLQTQLLQTEA